MRIRDIFVKIPLGIAILCALGGISATAFLILYFSVIGTAAGGVLVGLPHFFSSFAEVVGTDGSNLTIPSPSPAPTPPPGT